MAAQQLASVTSYKNPKLVTIHDVEIDKNGKFKYILIKVHDPDKDREFKFIVRGTSKASYHGMLGSLCSEMFLVPERSRGTIFACVMHAFFYAMLCVCECICPSMGFRHITTLEST